MEETKRQQILDALAARLPLILVADGYRTDAGLYTVFIDSEVPKSKHDLPCLLVFDSTADADDAVINGRTDYRLNITIEVVVLNDTSAKEQRRIAADVLKAIGVDDSFGQLAYRTVLKSVDTNVVYEHAHLTGAEISIGIDYRCPRWEI